MANKVVQLINEDNDNLYPLSGGVLSDSVTTDMLKNSSVTSTKINWGTSEWKTITSNVAGTSLAYRITFDKFLEVRFSAISSPATISSGVTSAASLPAELVGRINSARRVVIIGNPTVMFEVLSDQFRVWNTGNSSVTSYFQGNVTLVLDD